MIRMAVCFLLANVAGMLNSVIAYLLIREGHEYFAIAFIVLAFTLYTVPRMKINGGVDG